MLPFTAEADAKHPFQQQLHTIHVVAGLGTSRPLAMCVECGSLKQLFLPLAFCFYFRFFEVTNNRFCDLHSTRIARGLDVPSPATTWIVWSCHLKGC